MNLLKKAFIVLIMFFGFSFITSALVLESDIKIEESKVNSLDISWEEIEGALGYIVYYDTVSHEEDGDYSSSIDEVIEENKASIMNLQANTEYYIAVAVIDGDGEEGKLSKEFIFSTEEENKILESLKIESIKVDDSKNITIKFNKNLDVNNPVEFKIIEKDNNLNSILVDSAEIFDYGQVKLFLQLDLESNKTYNLTVISALGENGEVINAGVDGVLDFVTESNLIKYINKTLEEKQEIEEQNLNSAENKDVDDSKNELGGKEILDKDIKKTAESLSKEVEKLPQTGPLHWVLVLISLLLAMFLFKSRKQA